MFRLLLPGPKLTSILAGCLCWASLSFGQSIAQSSPDIAKITMSVDGLTCGAGTGGNFEVLAFSIGVNDIVSTTGAAVGKVTPTDLVVQKNSDACSLPLMLMAASGRPINHVVLTAVAKGNKPLLTITLGGAILSGQKLTGAEAAKDLQPEKITFSYATAVITDSTTNTTGTINR